MRGGATVRSPSPGPPQPAASTAGADGHASGAGWSARPVVQRLGSQGGSLSGEQAPSEAGIAVPVLHDSLQAVGAELLADRSSSACCSPEHASTATIAWPAGAAAEEQRRDTPPQHIAARHQQAAAAARREVEAALAKRRLRLELDGI